MMTEYGIRNVEVTEEICAKLGSLLGWFDVGNFQVVLLMVNERSGTSFNF
jgi:hypothetical protein